MGSALDLASLILRALPSSRAKAFVCLWQPSHLSLCGQRNVAQREATPLPRFPGFLPGKFASRGRAFRQHIPVLAKRHRHPCRCPLRGLATPTRRCRGAPGRAAGHRGPHSVRNRCAIARAEKRRAKSEERRRKVCRRQSCRRARTSDGVRRSFEACGSASPISLPCLPLKRPPSVAERVGVGFALDPWSPVSGLISASGRRSKASPHLRLVALLRPANARRTLGGVCLTRNRPALTIRGICPQCGAQQASDGRVDELRFGCVVPA